MCYIYIYTYVIYTHTYTHTRTHIHTYTYIHTYIYIYIYHVCEIHELYEWPGAIHLGIGGQIFLAHSHLLIPPSTRGLRAGMFAGGDGARTDAQGGTGRR